jgi:excisionase family DNA binding protein
MDFLEYDDEYYEVPKKKLITLKEASRIYSIPLNTLYKLSSQGKIPKYKIGKRVYIKPYEFEEWLEIYHIPFSP